MVLGEEAMTLRHLAETMLKDRDIYRDDPADTFMWSVALWVPIFVGLAWALLAPDGRVHP